MLELVCRLEPGPGAAADTKLGRDQSRHKADPVLLTAWTESVAISVMCNLLLLLHLYVLSGCWCVSCREVPATSASRWEPSLALEDTSTQWWQLMGGGGRSSTTLSLCGLRLRPWRGLFVSCSWASSIAARTCSRASIARSWFGAIARQGLFRPSWLSRSQRGRIAAFLIKTCRRIRNSDLQIDGWQLNKEWTRDDVPQLPLYHWNCPACHNAQSGDWCLLRQGTVNTTPQVGHHQTPGFN
jgi:hypothetical protein